MATHYNLGPILIRLDINLFLPRSTEATHLQGTEEEVINRNKQDQNTGLDHTVHSLP